MDSLASMGGSLLQTLGGDIDSIKGYFISAMLDMLGIKEEKTKEVISNVLEQVGMDDITMLLAGGEGACAVVTQDIVAGLIEYALEDGLQNVIKYIDDLDIPLIDGFVSKYAGGEGMLADKEKEKLINTITTNVYPIIGKKVEDFVCSLGFGGGGGSEGSKLGDDSDAAPSDAAEDKKPVDSEMQIVDPEAAEEIINEIFDFNIYHISQKLQKLSETRKKLRFIQNE
jgi:hypothetical protein